MEKTQGQRDYEIDLKYTPTYNDGTPRPDWTALDDTAKWVWERNAQRRAAE